jgi:BlaR1 peptidase M56
MFYLLCIALLLAVVFLVTAAATLVSLPFTKYLTRVSARRSSGAAANSLFVLRIAPIVAGALASFGLVLPAFLKFEPHVTHERPGAALVLLALLGAAAAAVICWRGLKIVLATSRVERLWLRNAVQLHDSFSGVNVFCVKGARSLLAVTGLWKPRIFVSPEVAGSLNTTELAAALKHEIAHVHAKDNLKQLFLKMTHPPRWLPRLSSADAIWANSAELAADERALRDGASAVDLASALVKVGRLTLPQQHSPAIAASHLVDGCSSSTSARAARLRELIVSESEPAPAASSRWSFWATAAVLVYALLLATMLPGIHEALEFLVR